MTCGTGSSHFSCSSSASTISFTAPTSSKKINGTLLMLLLIQGLLPASDDAHIYGLGKRKTLIIFCASWWQSCGSVLCCTALPLMHQGTLQSSLSPPHRNKSTNKCSHQEPRRSFCLNFLLFSPLLSPRQPTGPCDTNLIEGHLFLCDNDINDALQLENMFSALATQQMSNKLFCVQQPFATLFWTFPGWWVFCSKATFDGSIDTPSSNFLA